LIEIIARDISVSLNIGRDTTLVNSTPLTLPVKSFGLVRFLMFLKEVSSAQLAAFFFNIDKKEQQYCEILLHFKTAVLYVNI